MYISPSGAKWVVKHEGFCPGVALNRRRATCGCGVRSFVRSFVRSLARWLGLLDRINDKGARRGHLPGTRRGGSGNAV